MNDDDYIRRGDALNNMIFVGAESNHWCIPCRAVLDAVKETPPIEDVLKIVRCWECVHNGGTPHNPICDILNTSLGPDGYCSAAVRRSDSYENDYILAVHAKPKSNMYAFEINKEDEDE